MFYFPLLAFSCRWKFKYMLSSNMIENFVHISYVSDSTYTVWKHETTSTCAQCVCIRRNVLFSWKKQHQTKLDVVAFRPVLTFLAMVVRTPPLSEMTTKWRCRSVLYGAYPELLTSRSQMKCVIKMTKNPQQHAMAESHSILIWRKWKCSRKVGRRLSEWDNTYGSLLEAVK